MTVFIAEDNPILLHGLDRALSAHGYRVRTAEDGAGVLGMLATCEDPPDLLLLDVMMPGMSGLEVMHAVRAEPRWADVPVMLITAAKDETPSAGALHDGSVDVLVKPFRLGELLTRIEGHVQRRRARGRESAAEEVLVEPQSHRSA